MATATTHTPGNKGTPDLAQKICEQLASTMPQGQPAFVDAAQAWVKAVWMVPASDLFKAQFDSALQLADVVITDKHDSPMPLPDL
jgi:hypothetical protein